MTQSNTPQTVDTGKIEAALMMGDLGKLSEAERVNYYLKVCDSVGLNPYTQPFQYMILKGKMLLYATRACAEQLRKINKISLSIINKERLGDIYVVTARAVDKDNRVDESTGAVSLGRASGEDLANLLMKAETKAKRRVTLSISGLGFLDENEVDSIPGAEKVSVAQVSPLPSQAKTSVITTTVAAIEPPRQAEPSPSQAKQSDDPFSDLTNREVKIEDTMTDDEFNTMIKLFAALPEKISIKELETYFKKPLSLCNKYAVKELYRDLKSGHMSREHFIAVIEENEKQDNHNYGLDGF